MLNNFSNIFWNLELLEAQTWGDLTIAPFVSVGSATTSLDLTLLRDAIASGQAEVSEVNQTGVVSFIRIVNRGSCPILILDGEELIGAKQNRIANLTILVPEQSSLDIPVSCVEAARWSPDSTAFTASGFGQSFQGRARKSAAVGQSLRVNGSRTGDQHQVWDDVDEVLHSLGVMSPSRSLNDGYRASAEHLAEYERAFKLAGTEVGAAVLLNGAILGIEVFASRELFARFWHTLLASFAMEALVRRQSSCDPSARETTQCVAGPQISEFIETVIEIPVERHAAIGLGEDLRFESDKIVGAALCIDSNLVHFYAFSRIKRHGQRYHRDNLSYERV